MWEYVAPSCLLGFRLSAAAVPGGSGAVGMAPSCWSSHSFGTLLSDHRTIEWPGLKRSTMIISFQPPAMCRVANHQTRLPRTTSSLALNACRDGASTASLGNLFWCICPLQTENKVFWNREQNFFPSVLSLQHLKLCLSPGKQHCQKHDSMSRSMFPLDIWLCLSLRIQVSVVSTCTLI